MNDEQKQELQDLQHHKGWRALCDKWSVERAHLLQNLLRCARASNDASVRGAVMVYDRTDQMIKSPESMVVMSQLREREEYPSV